ncbi:MAG TPA: thiol reductant ABC exporter subunit CydC, partial [Ktedonobacterales bacterium]
ERSGDLHARIVADIETLEQFFVRVIEPPVIALCTTLALYLLLARYDQSIALVAVGFLILAGIGVPALVYALSRRAGQRLIAERAALNAAYVDTLQGMTELVAFGQARRWQEELRRYDGEVRVLQRRLALGNALGNSLGLLLSGWANLAVLVVAVPLISAGHVDGVLLATLVLMTQAAFEAVTPLAGALQALTISQEVAARIFALVDAAPEVRDPTGASPEPLRNDLAVRDLRFRYAPDEPYVLDGVSFTVPQGKLVAVVGPSGSGKTTLLHLLLRFWDYGEGACALGGYDLRQFKQADILRSMAVVSQQTHLFNTTLRRNLLLARSDASDEDIAEAVRRAQLDAFIAQLPEGYETRIGENGLRLSGGERQRLAVARALLKDAPVLLLDEPTAHLDAANARALLGELLAQARGKTTLLITHHLDGLEAAADILVLDGGKIVERGIHERLLAQGGLYRRMWDEQHGEVSDTTGTPVSMPAEA